MKQRKIFTPRIAICLLFMSIIAFNDNTNLRNVNASNPISNEMDSSVNPTFILYQGWT